MDKDKIKFSVPLLPFLILVAFTAAAISLSIVYIEDKRFERNCVSLYEKKAEKQLDLVEFAEHLKEKYPEAFVSEADREKMIERMKEW